MPKGGWGWATCTSPKPFKKQQCHFHSASGTEWFKSACSFHSKYSELCNSSTAELSGGNSEQCTCLQLFIGKGRLSFSRRDAHFKELKLQDTPGSLGSRCNEDSSGEHMTMCGNNSFQCLFYNLCQKLKSLLTCFAICYHPTPFKGKRIQCAVRK